MIDFDKLTTINTVDTVLNPRDLFNVLPNKNSKYQYARDVQSQVWKYWFEKRNNNSTIIKMNTGSGKTVVGLLILKSCVNEGKGPAVYVVPDNCLVEQVKLEADSLGLQCTLDANSPSFLRGKEILIINICKLVNGKSVFGVGEEGKKINIGSLIIDDAHACIDSVEEQFLINIKRDNSIYDELLKIFLPSLKAQSETKATEIADECPGTIIQVPFWTWQNNLSEITKILFKNRDEEDLLFKWPLLKEHLKLCRCVVGSDSIEITPHSIPIERIPSLEHAQRKIFMTATLVDDSVLSSHFNVKKKFIESPIFPDSASDIGDRMILIPQGLNPDISDTELKKYCKFVSKHMNVVVIVPSMYRVAFWQDEADFILNKENIREKIEEMKKNHIGLVILVNRYDGIDLPQKACRLLVIDGLPDVRRKIDKINESILQDNDKVIDSKIQKIEQGMGRGVRSNEDFCVVFLMGNTLVNHLYRIGSIEKFSSGTRAQFKLSENLSNQLKGKTLKELTETIKYCLGRDSNWVSKSKGILASLNYSPPYIDPYTICLRNAFDYASINNFESATQVINDMVNVIGDNTFKGYAMQILAEFVNFKDRAESQKILLSALKYNRNILKPIDGISYLRINAAKNQAEMVSAFIKENFHDNNHLLIESNAILDQLIFKPDTSNSFEESLKQIACFLGFNSQRPEKEYGGRGPDVLWAVGELRYFVFECKNGVTNELINKHDINQLNGSIEWFKEKYDNSCALSSIIIHLGNICDYCATPNADSVVMIKEQLEILVSNIRSFIRALNGKLNSIYEIQELITMYKLTPDDIIALCKKIKIKRG